MISIGWRNLRQSPLRCLVAVGSVAFAVVLITCEIGMMFGLTRNASILVDRSKADLLVSSPNIKTFDFASPIDSLKRYQVASVPGVAHVEEYNASMSLWKLADGGNAACQIVGIDLKGHLAPKPQMIAGRLDDLHNQDAVVIDQSARRLLGNPGVGDSVEIFRKRARVAGICRDMQSFSTLPIVFTSLRRGDEYGWLKGNTQVSMVKASIYFLVELAPGANAEIVSREIEKRVKEVEVHTRESLSWRTRRFWLYETGIGMAFLFVGFLGLMVGGVILSQTLFALTVERLNEFGVLKALGAGMPELSRVVLEQGLICGSAGLLLGLAISFGVQAIAQNSGTEVEIGWILVTCVSGLVMLLCAGASLLSIARLRTLEPAMVFRA